MKKSSAVWLITGCSTGLGRAIAEYALQKGYRTAATARRREDVLDLVAGRDESQALALALDVTDSCQIGNAVAEVLDRYGRIDVLVNNAGIGYFAAIEESDEDQARHMFEINFWGMQRTTRAVLPVMRAQRSGHIVNLSSVGGFRGAPAVGYYNASKFAMEGFSEALAHEVEPLGIRVMLVEPSGFRTDWAGRSANETAHPIEDYDVTAGVRRRAIRAGDGKQAGDPARAAAAIFTAIESPVPPLRLLLGAAAVTASKLRIETLRRDWEGWTALSASADAPPVTTPRVPSSS